MPLRSTDMGESGSLSTGNSGEGVTWARMAAPPRTVAEATDAATNPRRLAAGVFGREARGGRADDFFFSAMNQMLSGEKRRPTGGLPSSWGQGRGRSEGEGLEAGRSTGKRPRKRGGRSTGVCGREKRPAGQHLGRLNPMRGGAVCAASQRAGHGQRVAVVARRNPALSPTALHAKNLRAPPFGPFPDRQLCLSGVVPVPLKSLVPSEKNQSWPSCPDRESVDPNSLNTVSATATARRER